MLGVRHCTRRGPHQVWWALGVVSFAAVTNHPQTSVGSKSNKILFCPIKCYLYRGLQVGSLLLCPSSWGLETKELPPLRHVVLLAERKNQETKESPSMVVIASLQLRCMSHPLLRCWPRGKPRLSSVQREQKNVGLVQKGPECHVAMAGDAWFL